MAAVAAEMATFPLDTAKTRQQLQGQVGDSRGSSLRYKGIVHTLITIGREEGLTSIYRGLSPALVRQSVYGTIKFGLYYSSKDVAKRLVRQPQKESTLVNLCCAVVAGSVSATLATPTDVIKVRMQSGSMHKGVNISWSLLSVGKVVLRLEGIRGLWRGGLPTAQRAALVAGVQLPVYDATKSQMLAHGVPDGAACHMAASVLAGLFACIASNPVDVVRTDDGSAKNTQKYPGSASAEFIWRNDASQLLPHIFNPMWTSHGSNRRSCGSLQGILPRVC